MQFKVGQQIKIKASILVEGALTNSTDLVLKVKTPDGIVNSFLPTSDGIGVYHYNYTITQAGYHYIQWKSTTGVVGLEESEFHAVPTLI